MYEGIRMSVFILDLLKLNDDVFSIVFGQYLGWLH